MEDNYKMLANNLKRFVNLFFQEYSKYLNKDQLETIKNINYDNIIHIDKLDYPLGITNLGQIYFNNADELMETMKKTDYYGSGNLTINNKNYTNYLQYMCEKKYNAYQYYSDQLLYMIFKLVRRDDSCLNNGLINYEITYLCYKYNIRIPNLYKKEEVIVERLIKIIGHEHLLNIIFKSYIDAYIYLNNNLGYRFAELYKNVYQMLDENNLVDKSYTGTQGYIDYARDYDDIGYGDALNCMLEFNAKELH